MSNQETQSDQIETAPTKCGYAAIIGAPNAGKSTLLNQLAGVKLSIVTHKVQTTRARIQAILIEEQSQIILVDTPGIFKPRRRLDRAMSQAAWGAPEDADITALIIDSNKGLSEPVEFILKTLKDKKGRKILILNKIDLIEREKLLNLSSKLNEQINFEETFMISALKGDGTKELLAYLADNMPLGPWLFPEDQLTDAPMRFTAAEITREKLFLRLHEELPYQMTVETTDWKRVKKGVRIEQTIYVTTKGHKKMVIGKDGQVIKNISMEARKELKEIVGADVHLFLFVKVRPNWGDDPERFKQMGLEYTD